MKTEDLKRMGEYGLDGYDELARFDAWVDEASTEELAKAINIVQKSYNRWTRKHTNEFRVSPLADRIRKLRPEML